MPPQVRRASNRREMCDGGIVVKTLLRACAPGVDKTFDALQLTIGSGEDDDVRVNHPRVQPGHVVLTRDAIGWRAERRGPPHTLFVDGRSEASVSFAKSLVVRVGSLDGPAVTLQARGRHRRPAGDPPAARAAAFTTRGDEQTSSYGTSSPERDLRRTQRRLRRHTVALSALLGIVVAAALVPGRIEDFSRSQQLADVQRATVRLVARNSQGGIQYSGSGTIVDRIGLILTNAHVAKPSAPGLQLLYGTSFPQPDPAWFEVWLAEDGADFAKFAYRGRVVVADGWLDLAYVIIDGDKQGRPLQRNVKFPTVETGRRGGMNRGDTVHVVGYPALSGGEAQRISSGSVAAWLNDPRIPGLRDRLDTTATVVGGNSGGAVVDGQGRLIAVPTGYQADREAPVTAGLGRPVELARPLVEAIFDRATQGYRSPYLASPRGTEAAKLLGWSRRSSDGSCEETLTSTPPVGAKDLCAYFELSGMAPQLDVWLGFPVAPSAWDAQQFNGQSRAVFKVSLPDAVGQSLDWRLDIGGGTATIARGGSTL